MILPAPPGTALSIEFHDGHTEHIPESETVDEMVELALRRIHELADEHGTVSMIVPNTNRFAWVSPARAEFLHSQGVDTVDTTGMSYEQFSSMFPPIGET